MSMSQQGQSVARELSEQDVYYYFFPRSTPIWIVITISMIVITAIIVGVALSQLLFIGAGILFGIISTYIIHKRLSLNPDDESYDAWVRERAQELRERSLDILDIQPGGQGQALTIHSLVLPGSMEENEYQPGEVLMKQGKDEQLHFSINVYTFIFCTPRFLAIFKSDVNALRPSVHSYMHNIYPYSKIFGAITTQFEDTVILDERELPYRMEQFCLELTNGQTEVLSATVRARPQGSASGSPTIAPRGSNFDKKLSRLRQILLSY